jgi:hypothetical protein
MLWNDLGTMSLNITDVLPRETPDDIVFATAQDKGCVMITCN